MSAVDRRKRTGILLSGGIDSTALAYWRRPDVALTIDYGQRSAGGEVRSARQIASVLELPHEVIRVDCRALGSGDLAGTLPVSVSPAREWWPFRNQLLITFAAMRSLALGIEWLLIGSVSNDHAFKDGTSQFITLIDQLASIQEGGLRISAPAIGMESVELVRESGINLATLAWTHSCHRGDYACGECRGCTKHDDVFRRLMYSHTSLGIDRGNPTFDFDVAISFAGTEREMAGQLAEIVRRAGYSVFFDDFFAVEMWGQDLPVYFDRVFRERSRYCVIFASEEYLKREWTNLERQSAVARALIEKGRSYVLPVRVDDVDIPGIPTTVGYIALDERTIEDIGTLVVAKLGDRHQ